MMRKTHDPDRRLMATLAAMLEIDDPSSAQGNRKGDPLLRILALSLPEQEQKAKQLVAGWCAAKGLDVVASGDSEADRVINGQRVEIKFSTLWASDIYKFQQFRDQDYVHVICLGISPFDALAWVIPKAVLSRHYSGQTVLEGFQSQHGGRAGRDTWWLSFNPGSPPAWLSPFGGTLSSAFAVLRSINTR